MAPANAETQAELIRKLVETGEENNYIIQHQQRLLNRLTTDLEDVKAKQELLKTKLDGAAKRSLVLDSLARSRKNTGSHFAYLTSVKSHFLTTIGLVTSILMGHPSFCSHKDQVINLMKIASYMALTVAVSTLYSLVTEFRVYRKCVNQYDSCEMPEGYVDQHVNVERNWKHQIIRIGFLLITLGFFTWLAVDGVTTMEDFCTEELKKGKFVPNFG